METTQEQPAVPVYENPHDWDVSGHPLPSRALVGELVLQAMFDASSIQTRPRIIHNHARFYDFESAAWFATELRTIGFRPMQGTLQHSSSGAVWIDFPLEGLPT